MNGYSNNGFTQSLNGILSLTDGLGTTIENGQIITGDITGDDIISSSVTTSSLKSINHEISGNLTVDNNLTVDGTIYTKTLDIDTTASGTDAFLFPSAVGIYVGSNENTITYIKCYLECMQYAIFHTGLSAYDTSTLFGITNQDYPIQNNLTTDATSLSSTASTIINGGMIIKKNLYATDVMSDNLVSGDIGCGNLNSSNNITTIDLKCNTINCKKINVTEIDSHYKNKICCNINLGVLPYLSIPFTTTILDTTTGITNFNLQTYLINSNNNSIFIQPYYCVTFYNNENILQIIDNSNGSDMMYNLITFNQNLS